MRKFIAFLKVIWQLTITYRGESLVWFILEIIPLLIIISFWQSLLISGRIDSVQFAQLVIYYFLTLVITRLSSVHFEDWVIDDIKDGKISTYLIKPFSYQVFLMANEVTWRFSGIIYLLPIILAISPFISKLNFSPPSLIELVLFILILFIAFLQRYFIGFMIGMAAFWFEQSKSLIHLKWMSEGIFGGAWLPLYFFPTWLQDFSKFTPFYYWYYFPIELVLKKLALSEIIFGLTASVIWVLVLKILAARLWHRALYKYSAVGG